MVTNMLHNIKHNIKHSTVVQSNTQLEMYIFGQVTQKQRRFKTSKDVLKRLTLLKSTTLML